MKMPPVEYELIRLMGGLDLITPTLSLPPGFARDAINFEAAAKGGYTRVGGYERFSGKPRPSDAIYGTLTCNITGALAVGNTITGVTSAATGVVIVISGATVVYTKATGTFVAAETLNVAGTPRATITAIGSAVTDSKTAAQYRNLAADSYRADIAAVPGEGSVRGVAWLGSAVYAWRNNVGSTAIVLHKSTAAGWAAVALDKELVYTAGQPAGIYDGAPITGLVSGATAIVARVLVRTGTFAAGTAAGTLVLTNVVGNFQAAEAIQIAGTTRATASGVQTQIVLLPGGRVETDNYNFGGTGGTQRLYGCDGVNPAFEFDGTVYVPIRTGMTVDTPNHVVCHKNSLFLAFGSSVQVSSTGKPYTWTPVLGAGEIILRDAVTNFKVQPGDQSTGALTIYSRQTTCVLYGSSTADFKLVEFQDSTGAFAYTAQAVSSTYALDDRGVMNLAATLNYGNFDSASITQQIQPWLEDRQTLALSSVVNRRKSQYRLFFSDGYALYITLINNKVIGCMPMFFSSVFNVACEGEAANGQQAIYVGATDGFVYQLDVGTSFDGATISASLQLVFNSLKSPRVLKHYRHGSIEAQGDQGYAEFGFSYQLGYGSVEIGQPGIDTYPLPLNPANWDSFNWDLFVWDGQGLLYSEIEVTGTAVNIAVSLASQGDYFAPFTINSFILHYTPRRGIRS